MYIPDAFRVTDREIISRFIERHSFAILVSQTSEGPLVTHVPVLLDCGDGYDVLFGHVARANPHWRSFDGRNEVLAIFQGPHAYISPTWYETSPAVPTWNYAVVHAYGRPRVIDDASRVRKTLERLVAQHEASARSAWNAADLPPDLFDRLTDAIVAFEMRVERVEAKFKLGQNRSREDLLGVVAGLLKQTGPDGRTLAEFTREVLNMKAV